MCCSLLGNSNCNYKIKNMIKFQFLFASFALFTIVSCSENKGNGNDNNNETVKIGKQNWTIKNLNVAVFNNGDSIPEAKSSEEWTKASNESKPVWCYHHNDPKDWKKYGKIYNWYAVKDPRGLAPKGMHIPSDDEWDILIDFLGGENLAVEKLKSKNGWDDNCNGTNESGFNAIPGGGCGANQNFYALGDLVGYWWSSTEKDNESIWYRSISCQGVQKKIKRNYYDKNGGMRVRCIID